MADGLDTSSFDFYEGIRIFVPGALTLALGEGVNRTFHIVHASVADNALVGVLGALLIGLLFYFVDAPTRAAVFSSLMPTRGMEGWGKPQKGGLLNTYFIMLDADLPAPLRARALYMGSMFRIGYEAIILFLIVGCTVLSTPVWSYHRVRVDLTGGAVRLIVLGAVFLVATLTLTVRRDRFRNIAPKLTDSGLVGRNWIDVIVLVLACLSLSLELLWRASGLIVLTGPAVIATLWLFRYQRGYKATAASPKYRQPVGSGWSCLISACLVGCCLAIVNLVSAPGAPSLSETSKYGWLLCAVVGVVLIAARGHERRLRGAYSSQNTWLQLNEWTMRSKYF